MSPTAAAAPCIAVLACLAVASASAGEHDALPAADLALALDDRTDSPPAPEDEASAWTIRVEPVMWLVSPSGRVRLPATGQPRGERVRMETLNLDSPRVNAAGELHIRAGRVAFMFSGAGYGLDRRTTADEPFNIGDLAVTPGDALDVSYQYHVFQLTAGYLAFDRDFGAASAQPERAVDSRLRVHVVGGLRVHEIDIDVSRPGGPGSAADELFAEPLIGFHAELELARQFAIDLQITAGGFGDSDRSSASLDIVVGLHYRPHPNLGLHFGWRQIAYDLTDGSGAGEFEHIGRSAGIQAGVTLRF